MATLSVRRSWWFMPFFRTVWGAVVVLRALRAIGDTNAEKIGNWAARIIARRGLVFEAR